MRISLLYKWGDKLEDKVKLFENEKRLIIQSLMMSVYDNFWLLSSDDLKKVSKDDIINLLKKLGADPMEIEQTDRIAKERTWSKYGHI